MADDLSSTTAEIDQLDPCATTACCSPCPARVKTLRAPITPAQSIATSQRRHFKSFDGPQALSMSRVERATDEEMDAAERECVTHTFCKMIFSDKLH